MGNIVAVVGMCGAGKSVATEYFEKKGYSVIYFGGVTMKKLTEAGLDITVENEKMMREKLRKDYGMAAYATVLLDDITDAAKTGNVVLDGVYSWSELTVLKDHFEDLKVICIVVDRDTRYGRLTNREFRPLTNEEAENRDIAEIENLEKGGPIAFADYYILNDGNIDLFNEKLTSIYNKIEKVK